MENQVEISVFEKPQIKLDKAYGSGWRAESIVKSINGYDWKIYTSKGSRNLITCSCQGGQHSTGSTFATFKTALLSDPSVNLHKEAARGTKNNILSVHEKGIQRFEELLKAGELPGVASPEYVIEPGQIIFDEGLGHCAKKAIYNISEDEYGTHYFYVNLETLALNQTDRIRNIKDKYGIGTYYREGERIAIDELNRIVDEATIKAAQDSQQEEENRVIEEQKLQAKIEMGRPLVSVPAWAKGIIVAHLKKNESDIYTDYHAHSTTKTYYLAYSKHTRDLFPEMRKACLKVAELHELANAPEEWEHREKYSMGSGYYLSEFHHSGWEVRKGRIDPTNQQTLEKLFVAAAEGRYFCDSPHQGAADEETNSSATLDNETNFTLEETIHAKKGHQLYVAKVKEKVEYDLFLQYKKLAKTYDGYYSRYNREGAIPGFQFTTQEDAQNFIQESLNLS